jgi:hypothetical protein
MKYMARRVDVLSSTVRGRRSGRRVVGSARVANDGRARDVDFSCIVERDDVLEARSALHECSDSPRVLRSRSPGIHDCLIVRGSSLLAAGGGPLVVHSDRLVTRGGVAASSDGSPAERDNYVVERSGLSTIAGTPPNLGNTFRRRSQRRDGGSRKLRRQEQGTR